LKVPADAPVRKRPGAYSSKSIIKEGKEIKIILLDGRSFRDTLVHSTLANKKYGPNPTGDLLGEAQWEWLENELSNSTASIHIIGCGIQFISNEHGWEKWGNFPRSRQRFFKLLEDTKLSKINLPQLDQPVLEITASGLTHTWSSKGEEPNQYRIGELIAKRNFGLIHLDQLNKAVPKISIEIRGLKNTLLLKQGL